MTSSSTLFSRPGLPRLDQSLATPLYHQLYTILKSMIVDGSLIFGEAIPTEAELAENFGVSRITAKRAMDELAVEDLVERRRGRGTHVKYQYEPGPVRAPLTGMLQEIETMALNSNAIILECMMTSPPVSIAREFDLAENELALRLVRVRIRDGLRFGYYVSWTTGVKMPLDSSIFKTTPRLSYFRDNGIRVTHVTQTISATAASADAASALDISIGSPLLSLTRHSYNKNGNKEELRDYMHVLYNPTHFQYKMDLEV